MLNVAIIEDKKDYRDAFKNYFSGVSQEIKCSFAVDSIEKYKKYFSPNLKLDIVLVDIHLGETNGIQGIGKIRRLDENIEIIMLTSFNDSKLIFQALTAGADGYLLKDLTFEEIEKELMKTLKNGAAMSPQIARRIIKHFTPNKKMQLLETQEKLSQKENQIIQLVIDGKTYEEIAPILNLTINGLKYHIKNIYRKLQVKSKSGIIKKYFNEKKL